MFQRKFCFLIISAFCMFSCSPDLPGDVAAEYKKISRVPDYNRDVKPILSDKCFSCHGPDKAKQKAGLRLDQAESAFASLKESPGKVAIDPGDISGSELYHRIISAEPEYMMPTPESHLNLSAKEKAILLKWIAEGAKYKPHWAFVKPENVSIPAVNTSSKAINGIDHFILNRLNEEQLQHSPQANKELLLRRVSLDLTGLPPTIEELDRFLADQSPDAYEKQVDRLLSSKHYGEKMAVDWLDLARFGDSHGYTVDRLRDMSPYRDWVIKAFNQNMPYDKFIHLQLAGDLLPNPDKEMLIATAFNRNHTQNMEGGIIEEEFQMEYVADRTNTFGDAFMAISMGCARCHDHKYDPVSQKNYYELYSFFNNVKEAGQISWDDAMPSPTILLPTPDEEKVMRYLQQKVQQQEENVKAEKTVALSDFQKWITTKQYQQLSLQSYPKHGLQSIFSFDKSDLSDGMQPAVKGKMLRELHNAPGGPPTYVPNGDGKAIELNGDEWLDLGKTGIFRKADPFTIALKIFIPADLKEGVILHKAVAERLYNYRGYHLYLKNNRLELSMAHSAPSNAITKTTITDVPRQQWINVAITYDGSSKAAGLKLFINGAEASMNTEMDQLTKDILLYSSTQPGLQIGAWARGWGFKNGKVDDIMVYNRELIPYEVKILAGKADWATLTALSPEQITPEAKNILSQYYVSAIHERVQLNAGELKKLRNSLADSVENIKDFMVMRESPEPKKTFLLQRGSYSAPGEEVFANTPAAIFPFPKEFPKNRLGLAKWLTHKDHPLTARVAVNRIWQNFFGMGLVKTTEDFGNQGAMPTHPELLDWLAIQFIESGWDLKKLNKMIVMSATYRQDSKATPILKEKDPENLLLARGPSVRLSAEMIRDNVLTASGLINKQVGGPSVKPYQPDGLWEINNTTYTADTGSALYRRSLYVLVKRSVPNPTLSTFDAGSRSYCVVRRQKTNTPLQALVTLNDPTFVEASRVIGEEMCSQNDANTAIVNVFRKLTGRKPMDGELRLLVDLKETSLNKFRQNPSKAKGWLTIGQYKSSKQFEPALLAANAVVANTIMNADASITKR
jgi:hypothetical protein